MHLKSPWSRSHLPSPPTQWVRAALSPGWLNCVVEPSQLGQTHQIYLFTSISLISTFCLHHPSPSRQQGRQRWCSLTERDRLNSHEFPWLGEECQANISRGESSMGWQREWTSWKREVQSDNREIETEKNRKVKNVVGKRGSKELLKCRVKQG